MRSRPHRWSVTRGLGQAAVFPAAAFIVHQLRYLLAYGEEAGVALQRTGHSYLHSVVPWLVLAIALALGGFLGSLGRALAGHTSAPRYTLSLLSLWILCSAALVAIFTCQELLEGLFATGHPGGLAGVFGYGGWWAVPVSICIGLTLAGWLHGARWILQEVARRRAGAAGWRSIADLTPARGGQVTVVTRLAPLVGGWSGRGPPRDAH